MPAFASPEWIAELDAIAREIPAGGSPLRVRYRFPEADGSRAGRGYDLLLGRVVRVASADADPDGPPTPEPASVAVTIVQPWPVAREVAAGRLAAQQALLDGTVGLSGPVTELLAWGPTLARLDAAMADLRRRTVW